ncbi:MAG: extracellular solute-binding protein [Phycisphaerales bacterium]|nr:MAG: extracellular solute-binding protein [Phycisphaerales bacterium]
MPTTAPTRGLFCLVLASVLVFAAAALSGCDAGDRDEVVLYSSVDTEYLREVADAFRERHGVELIVVGDTEATKTTGLMERVLAERTSPRADVWWSSEPFATIRLAEEGLLAPFEPTLGEDFAGEGWPAHLVGRNDAGEPIWYGSSLRSRVIVYSTTRVNEADVPTTLHALTDPRWRGRVGIARPQFGTTRGHVGALLESWGEEAFERWLTAMQANGVRVYQGNATVVRAIADGEIDLALTDTDDVFAGQRNGWPVEMAPEPDEAALSAAREAGFFGESMGAGLPMVFPNTGGLIVGGPNPEAARVLMDFLLSAEVEQLLAETASRNRPVRPSAHAVTPGSAPDGGLRPGAGFFERVADRIPEALRICERVLGL